MTFKTIESDLKPILERIEEARADDMTLYAYYVKEKGANLGKVLLSREYRLKCGLASYDSVGRIRRKLQEHYANLRPTKEYMEKRRKSEKEYRKYAKGAV